MAGIRLKPVDNQIIRKNLETLSFPDQPEAEAWWEARTVSFADDIEIQDRAGSGWREFVNPESGEKMYHNTTPPYDLTKAVRAWKTFSACSLLDENGNELFSPNMAWSDFTKAWERVPDATRTEIYHRIVVEANSKWKVTQADDDDPL